MHIDTALCPSKYRLMLMAVFVLLVAVFGVALGLGWWQWVVFGLVLLGVGFWTYIQNTPVHLVSSDGLWQFLVQTPNQDELWQVDVRGVQDVGVCVIIDGDVVVPMERTVRFVIFKDMMDIDDYRKLRVLARF